MTYIKDITVKIPAYFMASVMIGIGLSFLHAKGTLTGGLPGLALLLSYIFDGVSVGQMLIALSMPFLIFGYVTKGGAYCVRVIVCMGLLAVITDGIIWGVSPYVPIWDNVVYNIVLHAVAGVLFAKGVTTFLNNHGNPGGVMILFYWIHRKTNISIGTLVIIHDVAVLVLGWALVVSFSGFLYSVFTIAVMSYVIRISKDKSGEV